MCRGLSGTLIFAPCYERLSRTCHAAFQQLEPVAATRTFELRRRCRRPAERASSRDPSQRSCGARCCG
eukprot:245180-Alexandrium_andersonii.AAC.1